MECPECGEQITRLGPQKRCPRCGQKVRVADDKVIRLYIVSTAFFFSLLLLGGIVAFLEYRGYTPQTSIRGLKYALTAAGVVTLFGMVGIERWIIGKRTCQAVIVAAIIVGAMAEAIAIYGIVLYLLGGGIKWFVILMAISIAGFGYLALRIPHYAMRIEKYTLQEDRD